MFQIEIPNFTKNYRKDVRGQDSQYRIPEKVLNRTGLQGTLVWLPSAPLKKKIGAPGNTGRGGGGPPPLIGIWDFRKALGRLRRTLQCGCRPTGGTFCDDRLGTIRDASSFQVGPWQVLRNDSFPVGMTRNIPMLASPSVPSKNSGSHFPSSQGQNSPKQTFSMLEMSTLSP